MFTVTWHYQDAKPLTQGGFETRARAERFIAYVESRRHRQTHTHAIIDQTDDYPVGVRYHRSLVNAIDDILRESKRA